jgi:hypothetical protein
MKPRFLYVLGACALLTSAVHAQNIDTTPSWDGFSFIYPFGVPDTSTYGQTFTVGSSSTLDSFSFFVTPSSGDPIDYKAYVYAWDGVNNHATGPALFASAPSVIGNSGSGFTEIITNTGGVSLTSGAQYVAFFSVSELYTGSGGTNAWGYIGSDAYSGGGFWFFNNVDDFSALTTDTWENFIGGGVDDLAFKASFSGSASAVPEPGAVAFGLVMGGGLGGLILRRRRSA